MKSRETHINLSCQYLHIRCAMGKQPGPCITQNRAISGDSYGIPKNHLDVYAIFDLVGMSCP